MRVSAPVALAFGAILAVPIVADGYDATTIHKHRIPPHHAYKSVRPERIEPSSTAPLTAQPEPNFFPYIAPYPPGQGDTDGLSRNPDDCNKGCIGGNPG
jgi:hypothetical protein